jgi:DNA-binding LacI/PurR family transcriptional regulator
MGRAAAELLMRLLAGETIPPAQRTIRLPVTLHLAASTAAPGSQRLA